MTAADVVNVLTEARSLCPVIESAKTKIELLLEIRVLFQVDFFLWEIKNYIKPA
jgi:hypothetical protein